LSAPILRSNASFRNIGKVKGKCPHAKPKRGDLPSKPVKPKAKDFLGTNHDDDGEEIALPDDEDEEEDG